MKKLIIALLIVVVGCSAVFAGDLAIGFSQGVVNTSFIASYDWDHFGVQGEVGFPVVFNTFVALGAVQNKIEGKDVSDVTFLDFVIPTVRVNAYWKAVDKEHFGWNLGVGAAMHSYFMEGQARSLGWLTLTSGLNYKFNDRFSMGLESSVPVALPVMIFDQDAAEHFVYAYQEGGHVNGDGWAIFFGGIFFFFDDVARFSFKWSI